MTCSWPTGASARNNRGSSHRPSMGIYTSRPAVRSGADKEGDNPGPVGPGLLSCRAFLHRNRALMSASCYWQDLLSAPSVLLWGYIRLQAKSINSHIRLSASYDQLVRSGGKIEDLRSELVLNRSTVSSPRCYSVLEAVSNSDIPDHSRARWLRIEVDEHRVVCRAGGRYISVQDVVT